MSSNIHYCGITRKDEYPRCLERKYCKEALKTTKLCIPPGKPYIESICSVSVNPCIEEYKIIDTMLGDKLYIEGFFNIKVMYVGCTHMQTVHSHCFNIPFSEFILLGDRFYDLCRISDLFIGIEEISVSRYNEKEICLNILMAICPIIIPNKPRNCDDSHIKYICRECSTNCKNRYNC